MPLLVKKQNPVAAILLLLQKTGHYLDPEKITAELDRHPDPASLLAISQVIGNFNIPNEAYRVTDPDNLKAQCPFIAHTKINGGDFVVVDKIEGDYVYLYSEKWMNHRLSLSEFNKVFNNVILTAAVSPLPKWRQLLYFVKSHYINAVLTCSVLLFLAVFFRHSSYIGHINWQIILLTLYKLTGMVTSVFLLVQSVDGNNPLIQKICNGGGKTDCNAILSSKAAKVFEGLTWSEVGFFYFAGTLQLILFCNGSALASLTLLTLNVFSLPYTIYSIYYQARVAKQWCVLCCTVQALLWLEAITLIIPIISKSDSLVDLLNTSNWHDTPDVLICMLLPLLLWSITKPVIMQLQQIPSLKGQLQLFKYNHRFFNNLLATQPRYQNPGEGWSIVLGNPQATHVITMVSNIYCTPCSEAHGVLHNWLDKNDDIQFRIIFNIEPQNNDKKANPSSHLMALNQLTDKTIVKQALHDWHTQKKKNYLDWASRYPVTINGTIADQLERQQEWCRIANVKGSPTFFIDGYLLPEFYQLADLTYMLD